MKALRDHSQLIYEAAERGRQEGVKNVARNMIARGFDVSAVAELTGLTPSELSALTE